MNIIIQNIKRKKENILKDFPDAVIVNVTSTATDEFQQLSPFYPVGGIPVPGMENKKAECVEGIWQGLKYFDSGIDESYFNHSMKNVKRTIRKYGIVKGHLYERKLLNYIDARKNIYLPAYKFVLDYKVKHLVDKLREIAMQQTLVLLDYETNESILDASKPLSHASIIKAAILNDYTILEKKLPPLKPTQGKLF
jgi:hypothetical protein